MNRDQGPPSGTPNGEAAGWVVRMASDQRTRGDEEAFGLWLAESPSNADDYLDHVQLWNDMAALGGNAEARAILGMPQAHSPGVDTEQATDARVRFLSRRSVLGGIGLAAAAGGAFMLVPGLLAGGEVYESRIGEQRRILLADGSAVTLNTDTRLRVELRADERRLFLDRGQAHFQVARDGGRPFRVFVEADEVRALGTEFEIWRRGPRARVTLTEGVVAIYRGVGSDALPPSSSPRFQASPSRQPTLTLERGQQTELADDSERLAPRPVDIAAVQAWRSGRMILDDVPLGEVVADINRYGGRRIELADPSLAQMRVSGVFHTARPEALVDGVTTALPVRIARQDAHTLILASR